MDTRYEELMKKSAACESYQDCIKAMTDVFGLCGVGWKYDVVNVFKDDFHGGVVVTAHVNLYILNDKSSLKNKWGSPIPGFGSEKMVVNSRMFSRSYESAVANALLFAMMHIGVDAARYVAGFSPIVDIQDAHQLISNKAKIEIVTKARNAGMFDLLDAVVKHITHKDSLDSVTMAEGKKIYQNFEEIAKLLIDRETAGENHES